jgi:acyl-CoA thioesterase
MASEDTPIELVDFATATMVTGRDRRYTGTLHPDWDGVFLPHGGVLGALALSAIHQEIDPDGDMVPRALTCHYLRAPKHGEVVIDVDPLRRGRRFASARATISQGGKACVSLLSTFSVLEIDSVEEWAVPMPDVAPAPSRDAPRIFPEEFTAGSDGWLKRRPPAPPYFEQVLLAPRFGTAPFAGAPIDLSIGTENGGWLLSTKPQRINYAWLAYVVDALWPTALQPLTAPVMSATLDLTTHFRGAVPPDGLDDQPLLVHNSTRAVLGGLAEQDTRVFSEGGDLLAQARQEFLLTPLDSEAVAT